MCSWNTNDYKGAVNGVTNRKNDKNSDAVEKETKAKITMASSKVIFSANY